MAEQIDNLMIQRKTLYAGKALGSAALSVALTYAVSLVTPLGSSASFWLRGAHHIAYVAIYLPLLTLGLAFALRSHHNTRWAGFALVLFGTTIGYLAGLLATVGHPLFLEDGFHQIAQSLKLTTPQAWIALLWFPIRLQSWLFGMLSACILLFLRSRLAKSYPT